MFFWVFFGQDRTGNIFQRFVYLSSLLDPTTCLYIFRSFTQPVFPESNFFIVQNDTKLIVNAMLFTQIGLRIVQIK
jgi:hypothetical protein